MSMEKITLGQPVHDIQAAMTEENCMQCFGCPYATLQAARIVHRTNLLLEFTYTAGLVDADLYVQLEEEVRTGRERLHTLTTSCDGFSESKRENGLPTNMCESPHSPDYKISVIAGRIREFLGIP